METGAWLNLKSASSSFISQDEDIEILGKDSPLSPNPASKNLRSVDTKSTETEPLKMTSHPKTPEGSSPEESYLRVFSGDDADLDQIIDTETPEQILESQRFDQKQVLLRLIKTAQSVSIPPDQLYADMKTLIQTDNQYSSHDTAGDTIKTMLTLKKKYCAEENALSADSVTMFRLRIMFPQYACPLAEDTLLHRVTSFIFDRIGAEDCSNKLSCPIYSNLLAVRCIMAIPAGMKTVEFASAIPTKAVDLLSEQNRRRLIVAHLAYQILLNYYIRCDTPLKKIPPPTPKVFNPTLVKTKVQITNGLLSDKQRLYFLQDMGWVKLNGEIDETVQTAVGKFEEEFSEAYRQIKYKVFSEDPDAGDDQSTECDTTASGQPSPKPSDLPEGGT